MRIRDERNEELKVGDTVYKIADVGIIPVKITQVCQWGFRIDSATQIYDIAKSKVYFFNEKEAEEYLKEQNKIKTKKKMLYEYEVKLNKELNIDTFLIKY